MTVSYFAIFWRTFAQLASAAMLAVAGLSWATSQDAKANATALGLGLLLAFIGALVAVLWAFSSSPAFTALEKALRSAAQTAAGALGAIILNQVSDLFQLPPVLIAAGVSIVFAFFITYFSYQPAPPPRDGNALPPR